MIRIVEYKSRFGAITILKTKRTGSLTYSQGGSFQSEADGNGISLASYIHAVYGLSLISRQRRIRRVVRDRVNDMSPPWLRSFAYVMVSRLGSSRLKRAIADPSRCGGGVEVQNRTDAAVIAFGLFPC